MRIAFPPGPRRKGTGKVISVLHPKSEKNPKCEVYEKDKSNPSELLIFGNPSKLDRQRAARERAERIRAARLNPDLYDTIRHGDRITIVNRFGQQRTGRAVMLGPAGWVLNMGGPHGTPAIASRENVVRVKKANPGYFSEKLEKGSHVVVIWANSEAGPFYVQPYVNYGETRVTRLGKYKTLDTARRKAKGWLDTGPRLNAKRSRYVIDGKKVSHRTFRKELRLGRRRHLARYRNGKSNPSDTSQAVHLYQSFHGKEPKEIVEKHVSAAVRKDYAALGDLDYLKVKTPLGETVRFEFERDGVKLASSPDGKTLYAIGGNQNLSHCLDKASQEKDFIDLGDALEVQYTARKVHAGFTPISYYHEFGENSGALPRLGYDKLRKQIFFIGGEYFIDTSKGVSPGIEN